MDIISVQGLTKAFKKLTAVFIGIGSWLFSRIEI
jgi:hypothetical protein